MQQVILMIHVLVCLAIIVLVLLQHGKGAEAGATFGGGQSSNTMFGSQGALPFLMKLTMVFGVVFFTSSMLLAYLSGHAHHRIDRRLPVASRTVPVHTAETGVVPLPASPVKVAKVAQAPKRAGTPVPTEHA